VRNIYLIINFLFVRFNADSVERKALILFGFLIYFLISLQNLF